MKKRMIALAATLILSLQCGTMSVFADDIFDCDESSAPVIEIKTSKIEDTGNVDNIVQVNVIGYQLRWYSAPITIKKTTLYGKVWNPSKLAYENSTEVYDTVYNVVLDENYDDYCVGTIEFENFSNCALQVTASYETNENFEDFGIAPKSGVINAAWEDTKNPGTYHSYGVNFEDFLMTRPSGGYNQEKLKNVYDAIGDTETTIGRIVVRVSVAG